MRVRGADAFDLGYATLSTGRLRPPPPLPAGPGERSILLAGVELFDVAARTAYEATMAEVGRGRRGEGTA